MTDGTQATAAPHPTTPAPVAAPPGTPDGARTGPLADAIAAATGADGVLDLDALGDLFTRDPYPVYAWLRERGTVHRVRIPEGTDAWLVLGHEAARAALNDDRFSKSWAHASSDLGLEKLSSGTSMLVSDPPRHTRLRKLVAREFTARRVEAMAPRVQEMTDELLDAMLARADGRADLLDALAFPLPMSVICELLGVPFLDRDSFRGWTEAILTATPATMGRAAAAKESADAYLAALVERRRDEPGDDLFSGLIRTTDEDGDTLSSAELMGMAWLLLVAGHETTVHLIANGVLALLTHPEQLAALRADPSLIDNAVEEMLRFDGPVETPTYRFTLDPVEIDGTVIPGGGALVLPVLADADHDPARFPEPGRFDIRRETRGHVAFGHGIHFCLGAPLARLEARTAIATLLDRAPNLALDTHPDALTWRPGMLIRGPRRLPVRFA
ncbi:cytochrome P450 family protein [Streptomyces daliensis]